MSRNQPCADQEQGHSSKGRENDLCKYLRLNGVGALGAERRPVWLNFNRSGKAQGIGFSEVNRAEGRECRKFGEGG